MSNVYDGLYIDGRRVDIDAKEVIAFTFQSSDTNNPQAIKVGFSKTIKLLGTKNNNAVFGDIWRLDHNIDGYGFNPKERVPFTLYSNGDVIESGYISLDSITRNGSNVQYNVTLYGQLGDFFYSLMYDENGNERMLDDLYFGFEDNTGKVMTPEEERKYLINWNADYILESWNRIRTQDNSIYSNITAAPCYNGMHSDFDNDKVYFLGNYDNVQYQPFIKKGESVILTREISEYEASQLYSDRQRPAIRLSRVLRAIGDSFNNGGYKVSYDDEIMRPESKIGQYVNNSWIIFNQMNFDEEYLETVGSDSYRLRFGTDIYKTTNIKREEYLDDASKALLSSNNYTNVKIGFRPVFTVQETSAERLYDWADGINYIAYRASAVNADGSLRKGTTHICLTRPQGATYGFDEEKFLKMMNFLRYQVSMMFDNDYERENQVIEWNYNVVKSETEGLYTFDKGFYADVDITGASDIRFDFMFGNVDKAYNMYYPMFVERENDNDKQFRRKFGFSYVYNFLENNTGIVDDGKYVASKYTMVNKRTLFGKSGTIYDYLLSFTKMFNLRFVVDNARKEIKIIPFSKFYDNGILDIGDRIDYGKEVKVTPYTTKYKWAEFTTNTPDTYVSYLYGKRSDKDYGSLKVNTNYNLNNDVNDVLDGNIYDNFIDYRLRTPYVYFKTNHNYLYMPTFDIERADGTKETVKGLGNNPMSYDDARICFFDNDSNGVEGITIAFLNGIGRRGMSVVDNDIEAVYANDGKPCYVYDPNATFVYPPLFNRFYLETGISYYPVVPDAFYAETSITDGYYNVGWRNYIDDIYDLNAKKVECYVYLPYINPPSMMLRRVYYFDNCYWYLESVSDYVLYSNKPTKCTFVKIKNINNFIPN